MEDRKTTPVVGDVGFSSITASVEEVGEVLDWISDLETSGSLCRTLNGIRVWVGGVESRIHGGVDLWELKFFLVLQIYP